MEDFGDGKYIEIIKKLVEWKERANKKPLLLKGVRQCGKKYIVKEFAEKFIKKHIYVNFESEEKLSGIFEYDFQGSNGPLTPFPKVKWTPDPVPKGQEMYECKHKGRKERRRMIC